MPTGGRGGGGGLTGQLSGKEVERVGPKETREETRKGRSGQGFATGLTGPVWCPMQV